jgi:hypothetical protein
MPTWDLLNSKSIRMGVNMRKVNCKDEKCDEIQMIPTIILHKRDGSQVVYDGKRNEQDLEEFIKINK